MKFPARALSTSTSGGTSSLELLETRRSFRSLIAAATAGPPFYYYIESLSADEWEEGLGRVVAGSPPMLERLVVTQSSNSDALVDFEVGPKNIALCDPSVHHAAAHLHKAPARVAITTPVTLSELMAGASAGGVVLVAGDRVLTLAQADARENGLHVIATAVAPTRPVDFYTDDMARGSTVAVLEGTHAGSRYTCTSAAAADVIDTHNLTFVGLDLDNAIRADGSIDFTADQSLGGHKLTDVADPDDDQDAATKKYVDDAIAGIEIPEPGASDAENVTYTPSVETDWSGESDPGNVDDALDQLASRVNTLEDAGPGGGGDASDVTYTPAFNSDWSGETDPGNVDDALDQLAARVKDVEDSPPGGADIGTGQDTALLRRNGTGGTAEDAPGTKVADSGKLQFQSSENPVVELEVEGTSSAQTATIDWDQSNRFDLSGEGNIELLFANVGANGLAGQTIHLLVNHGDTPIALDYPSSVRWPSETEPVLTNIPGRSDLLIFSFVRLREEAPVIFGAVGGLNYRIDPSTDPLLWDGFTGTNDDDVDGRTPDTFGDGTWASSGVTIQGNTAKTAAGGGATYDVDATEYTLSALFKLADGGGVIGLLVHYIDNNNYYVIFIQKSSGTFYMQLVSGGSVTGLTNYSGNATVSVTDDMPITVEVRGGTIEATCDGETISADVSLHSSATRVGFTGNAGFAWDDFKVLP